MCFHRKVGDFKQTILINSSVNPQFTNGIGYISIHLFYNSPKIEKMASVATIDVQDKKFFFKARDKWLKYPFDNAVSKEREKQGIEEVKKLNVFLD